MPRAKGASAPALHRGPPLPMPEPIMPFMLDMPEPIMPFHAGHRAPAVALGEIVLRAREPLEGQRAQIVVRIPRSASCAESIRLYSRAAT